MPASPRRHHRRILCSLGAFWTLVTPSSPFATGRTFQARSGRLVLHAADNADFARQMLNKQWERSSLEEERLKNEEVLWAKPLSDVSGAPPVGSVVIAHPKSFFEGVMKEVDEQGWGAMPVAGERTISSYMRANASRRERGEVLPVVLITERNPLGTYGLQLGCWSGRLLGDMNLPGFWTRPLYVGGKTAQGMLPSGLSALHPYAEIEEGFVITDDELCICDESGYAALCDYVERGGGSSWRVKFFINRIFWPKAEEGELHPGKGIWIPLQCSRELILREPDSSWEEPLWVQLATKAGGDVKALGQEFGLFPKQSSPSPKM